ncbi:hypothetical protein ACS0TY_013952 [Phlomoides rotata]
MAATTVIGGCKTTTFFPSKPPPSQKLFLLPKQLLFSNYMITLPQFSSHSTIFNPRSVSSPETSVVEEEAVEEESRTPTDNEISSKSDSLSSLTGCKACGREDIERGCNGEGRIQGGIATVPSFGWWPIKAYRPCPAFVESGGRYRRTGQSMDEVVSGKGVRDASDR